MIENSIIIKSNYIFEYCNRMNTYIYIYRTILIKLAVKKIDWWLIHNQYARENRQM